MAVDRPIAQLGRRLRVGFVGGGADSVIGSVHQIALRADGLGDLVAGAFSIDPQVSRETGAALLLDPSRIYDDWEEMLTAEASRDDRIDAVVVITPPSLHQRISSAFLAQGFHVLCEKPMTDSAEAADILARDAARATGLFALTHCYTGYPMVREARELIGSGAIGEIRLIESEHAAGGPDMIRDPEDRSRRHWRFRRESMGIASVLGEVGSHPHNISEYVTGQRVQLVSASLSTIAPGREVFDNAYLNVTYDGGAVGRIWSSFVAAGQEHGLGFRIFGDEGSLQWRQEDPEFLWHLTPGQPLRRISRGLPSTSDVARDSTRLGWGHPEGYLMAFANIYRDFLSAVVAHELGGDPAPLLDRLPGIDDGLSTMRLIDAAVRSHEAGGQTTAVTGSR
jgi:predicted dehydrogenase